jgi:hypothetical protein
MRHYGRALSYGGTGLLHHLFIPSLQISIEPGTDKVRCGSDLNILVNKLVDKIVVKVISAYYFS